MPRVARFVVPGMPHHVTQRGNRRHRTFFCDADYRLYLRLLRDGCAKAGTAVWGWCLMPNHVHLILVPTRPDGLAEALRGPHWAYASHVNRRENWRGHLWQSRFASVPMDEPHLHVCFRYVELNPIRAGLVARPEEWPWSSARAHLGRGEDGLTELAPMRERVDDWRAFLAAGLSEAELDAIRVAERNCRPLGGPAFLDRIAALLGRDPRPPRRGRPRRPRK
jgi:REP-associated tyrosine transposase